MTKRRNLTAEIHEALQDDNLQQALSALTQGIRVLRAQGLQSLPNYQELRERAQAIKEDVIANLDGHLESLKKHVEARGGRVFFARDGEEASRYIQELVRSRRVTSLVKAKSMTGEEIGLTEALEAEGLTVIETDLGERIVQLARERPSHLIGPAVHKTVDEVRELFARWLGLPDPPREPAALAALARPALREAFFEAQMGLTGVNFAVAETGTIVLVENEGNIRLTARLPKTHIALMGIEKIVPTLEDLIVFLKLLPRSGTGQKLTSYVSFLSPTEDFHLILLDNGRSRLRRDLELREALYCIRCGACLDSCPSYQAVGGHVFGGSAYMGGIGAAWTAGVWSLEEASQFNELCTSCGRCTEVCPVMIDIPWLNTVLRKRARGPTRARRLLGDFDRWARLASRTAPLSSWLLKQGLVKRALGLDPRRALLDFKRRMFTDEFRARRKPAKPQGEKVAFFVDCFSNHFEPEAAGAAVRVLERLGIDVALAGNGCCGRAALSQGLIDGARTRAARVAETLLPLIEQGYAVVGVEPSCTAALRSEYRHLLPSESASRLREGVFEVMEYLAHLRNQNRLSWDALIRKTEARAVSVLYHGHCQQKALGTDQTIIELLRSVPGLTLDVVDVSCCGMAGSFGYKREFSELSRQLGRRLVRQFEGRDGELIAGGFSCRSQIRDLTGRSVRHPVQLLADLLGG